MSLRELERLTDQVAALAMQVSSLSAQVARLEARNELFAPFVWVHELISPLQGALSELSKAVAVLSNDDAHIAEKVAEITAGMDELIKQIQQIAQQHEHDAQNSATAAQTAAQSSAAAAQAMQVFREQLAHIEERVKTITSTLSNDKKDEERQKGAWGQIVAWGERVKNLSIILTFTGAVIVFWFTWGRPIAAAVGEVISRALHSP